MKPEVSFTYTLSLDEVKNMIRTYINNQGGVISKENRDLIIKHRTSFHDKFNGITVTVKDNGGLNGHP